jgi:divalent metal cation (Fe/Co/Zn/Cd) transporter
MKPVAPQEFPAKQQAAYRSARRLEWASIAYLASAAVFVYFVMGSSQAMRTSYYEDLISLVPPLAFLIAARVARRAPSKRFPYGLHGAVSIGYLTAALALFAMGAFLLIEAAHKLFTLERTTIGGYELFGTVVWAGWPMLAALAYSGIPSYFLGRAKLRLAGEIHDKVLYADAEMNRADWMAEAAAAVGVLGTGLGLWWADAAAAALVSLDIVRDGLRNLRTAVSDLLDEAPQSATREDEPDPLPERLARHLAALDWVESVEVRMREAGHVFIGEAYVVPKSEERLVERVAELSARAKAFDWRVQELAVMPVRREALQAAEETRSRGAPENPRPRGATARRRRRR